MDQVQSAEIAAKPATVTAYKGFQLGYVCREHAFEIGAEYSVEGAIEACSNGFHACEHPLSVFEYYPPATSVYAVVELSGDMDVEGDKTAARTIKVVRKLSLTEMIDAAIEHTKSRATPVEGGAATEDNQAATASGTQGAATASGTQGAATASGAQGAATASGYQGAATASGDQGAATASGKFAAAFATCLDGKVSGVEGSSLHLDERLEHWGHDDHGKIIAVWAGIAGKDGIKPDTFYRLVDGKPVEVA